MTEIDLAKKASWILLVPYQVEKPADSYKIKEKKMKKSNAKKVWVSLNIILKESCAGESENIKTRTNCFRRFKILSWEKDSKLRL